MITITLTKNCGALGNWVERCEYATYKEAAESVMRNVNCGRFGDNQQVDLFETYVQFNEHYLDHLETEDIKHASKIIKLYTEAIDIFESGDHVVVANEYGCGYQCDEVHDRDGDPCEYWKRVLELATTDDWGDYSLSFEIDSEL